MLSKKKNHRQTVTHTKEMKSFRGEYFLDVNRVVGWYLGDVLITTDYKYVQ